MVNEGFEDYQKSFELLGDYIAHIHIKNGILAPDGEDELGACKWKRVWTPLKKWDSLLGSGKEIWADFDNWEADGHATRI